jgi:hypothetical protein
MQARSTKKRGCGERRKEYRQKTQRILQPEAQQPVYISLARTSYAPFCILVPAPERPSIESQRNEALNAYKAGTRIGGVRDHSGMAACHIRLDNRKTLLDGFSPATQQPTTFSHAPKPN